MRPRSRRQRQWRQSRRSTGRQPVGDPDKLEAGTTLQRLSLPLDAAKLAAPYGKLAVYNNATGQTVTIKSLKVGLRKVS